jgi:hypothetical protein
VRITRTTKVTGKGQLYFVNKFLKGGEQMSEREKDIVKKLNEAIPKMSDFDKGYILGKVENMAEKKKDSKESKKENK